MEQHGCSAGPPSTEVYKCISSTWLSAMLKALHAPSIMSKRDLPLAMQAMIFKNKIYYQPQAARS